MKYTLLFLLALLTWDLEAIAQEYFQHPVQNRTCCIYTSTNCAAKGKHHTAIDYCLPEGAPIKPTASGKIVYVEYMNSRDHGMGTNLIIEHTLTSKEKVYSSYSHLQGVPRGVSKGQWVKGGKDIIGYIGGSGYGRSNYWGAHLHFEIKAKAVTQSPWGGTFWGYTPRHPNNYGYYDPFSFIGKK